MAIMYHMYPMHCMHVLYPHIRYMHGGIYKRGKKKEIGFAKLRNQASFVLIQKLIKKIFIIHFMYLVSQI